MGDEGVTSIAHQQVGVVWPSGRSDGLVVSVDLDGNLNYLVDGTPKPTRVIQGHQKNITAAGLISRSSTLFTGSYEGRICAWDISSGAASTVSGDAHTNYVAGFSASPDDDSIYSVGWDDTLRSESTSTTPPSYSSPPVSLSAQPKGLACASSSTVLVASSDGIVAYKNSLKASTTNTKFSPTAIAAHGTVVAVGGDDKITHLYTLSADSSLSPTGPEDGLRRATAAITALAFSPNGAYLAAGTGNGKIIVYSTSDWSIATDRWSAHTARITSIAWDPSSKLAASGSLDTNVFFWSLENPGKRTKAGNAHKDGVTGVVWVEEKKVLSTGGDATVKAWKVEGLA